MVTPPHPILPENTKIFQIFNLSLLEPSKYCSKFPMLPDKSITSCGAWLISLCDNSNNDNNITIKKGHLSFGLNSPPAFFRNISRSFRRNVKGVDTVKLLTYTILG